MDDAVPAVTPPPSLPALPPGWDGDRLLELAREVAMNIQDLPVILQNSGLTQQQYDQIATIPFYTRALEAMRVDWESAGNTNKRLAIKAATALEATLPKLTGRLSDKEEGLDAVVKGAHLLAKIAGVDENKKQSGDGADKFTITINLGADQKLTFEKDITPKAEESTVREALSLLAEGPGGSEILRDLAEGKVDAVAVRSFPEGASAPPQILDESNGAREPQTVQAEPAKEIT